MSQGQPVLSPWDKHGPKYILSDTGVKYDGHFDDHSSVPRGDISAVLSGLRAIAQEQIEKSVVYKRYFMHRRSGIDVRQLKLFLEIVAAARNKFISDYPGSEFHVILWDQNPNDRDYNMVKEGLQKKEINLHMISNVLPQFSARRSNYEISPYDKHPNTLAHTYIAQYVIETIVGYDDLKGRETVAITLPRNEEGGSNALPDD
jgi:hypothetical protein